MAKPLIGPVPNMNRAIAVIRVVTWESTMVRNALPKPASMLERTDFPRAYSSRIRSKMRTLASTAMPIESTIPAIPGRVRVALRIARPVNKRRILRIRALLAIRPEVL